MHDSVNHLKIERIFFFRVILNNSVTDKHCELRDSVNLVCVSVCVCHVIFLHFSFFVIFIFLHFFVIFHFSIFASIFSRDFFFVVSVFGLRRRRPKNI